MKTKTLFSLLALAGIMLFISCEKDPSPLSKEQATTELAAVTTDYTSLRTEYDASPASKAMKAIGSLNLDFDIPSKAPSTADVHKKDVLNSMKSKLMNTTKGGDGIDFDFNAHIGTWTYNSSTQKFDHISTPTNQVVIVFPFNGSTTNNATLTYYDYVEGSYSILGESGTFVKGLKAKVVLTGQTTPIMSWVYTGDQSITLSSISMSFSMIYSLGDFTQTESANMTMSETSSSGSISGKMLFELKKKSDVIYSTSATISMSGNQTTFTSVAHAELRITNIIIKWDINATNTTDMDGDPSKYMTVAVWTAGGAKVADIVFVNESGKYVPYFKYADGTTQKVSERFGSDTTPGTILYEISDFLNTIFDFGL